MNRLVPWWWKDPHERAWRLYLWRSWWAGRFRVSSCSWCGKRDFIMGLPVGDHRDCPPF